MPGETPAVPGETPAVPGETPVNPEETPVEPVPPEVPVEQPEEPVSYMSGKLTASGGIYNVTVTLDEDAAIPEGATLSVTALTEADDAWQEAYQLVNPGEDKGFAALDISILDAAGEKIEPKASVDVQIELTQPFADMAPDGSITIQHVNKSFGEEPVLEFVTNRNGGSSGMVTVDEDAVQTWLEEAADWAKEAESWLEGLENWLNSDEAKALQKEFRKNPPIVANFTVSSFSTYTISYVQSGTPYHVVIHVVDTSGKDLPDGTYAMPSFPESSTNWTAIGDYQPTIVSGGYVYTGVYANSYNSRNSITYIKFYHRDAGWFNDEVNEWRYTNWTDYLDYASSSILTDIYFVYESTTTYTATFNLNGGSGTAPEPLSATAGNSITLPSCSATMRDKMFAGWKTADNDTVYQAGDSYPMTADTNFYAVWVDKTVRLTFHMNGGTGDDFTLTETPHATITLPPYEGTNGNNVFLGWSTDRDANGIGAAHHRSTIYPEGSEFEVPESNTRFYAIWAPTNVDASFFIRLDGNTVQEPSLGDNYPPGQYTKGVSITNALNVAKFYYNALGVPVGTAEEGAILAQVPSNSQLVKMINAANLGFTVGLDESNNLVVTDVGSTKYDVTVNEELYVIWYVVKHIQQSTGIMLDSNTAWDEEWHVDGVLKTKAKVRLDYDMNCATTLITSDSFVNYQCAPNTPVKAGSSGSPDGTVIVPTRSDGYVFAGWEAYTEDENGAYTVYAASYASGDPFTLATNTLLVAQWVKGGSGLTIVKHNGLGERLGNVVLTITAEDDTTKNITTSSSADWTGTYKYETVYTVHEESAPAGYQTINDFCFRVKKNTDGITSVELLDKDGHSFTTEPEGYPNVRCSVAGERVTITIVNYASFYVFHSSDGTVVDYQITSDADWRNEDGHFNIVNKVASGYLYGGYYYDYGGKGSYAGDGKPVNDFQSYVGNQTFTVRDADGGERTVVAWNADQADTKVAGTAITPVAGKTYYLKEVPNSYLNPAVYVVYDNLNDNKIVKLHLLSATDDKNYRGYGLGVKFVGSGETADLSSAKENEDDAQLVTAYKRVNVSKMNEMNDVLVVKNTTGGSPVDVTVGTKEVFGESTNGGYLLLSEEQRGSYIAENSIYEVTPYFVTLDGVKVKADLKMRLYLRDSYFHSWKAGNNSSQKGITKVGLPVHEDPKVV